MWELPEGKGVQPPLNVFNLLVALVYLSWGSDVTPADRTYRHWQFLCVTKISKMLHFLVNTCFFNS